MLCRKRFSAGGHTAVAALGVVLTLVGIGCGRKIGDGCSLSTDCSAYGDRLCDITQPGGYCTMYNCEPDSCPPESVCAAFAERSCPSLPTSSRFLRTFCMRPCKSNGDCRGGYICRDEGANVIDTNPQSRGICVVATSIDTTRGLEGSAICQPGPPVPFYSKADAQPPIWQDASSEDVSSSEASTTDALDQDATTADGSADVVDAVVQPDQSAADGASQDVRSESVGVGDGAVEADAADGAADTATDAIVEPAPDGPEGDGAASGD